MRPLVSYDDISEHPKPLIGPQVPFSTHHEREPPSKKRKHWNQKGQSDTSQPVQQWDDIDGDKSMNYGDDGPGSGDVDGVADGESRELTYEEIWDDSALIDAWNAATEEYEIYHGPEKNWKKEPVNKSPLWYNIPPSPSKHKKKVKPAAIGSLLPTEDSTPQNFETFVPDHDPTLSDPQVPYDNPAQHISDPPGQMISQDEAFNRALGAMYWGGYWTAVYHCQSNGVTKRPSCEESDEQADANQDQEVDAEEEDFVSTQR